MSKYKEMIGKTIGFWFVIGEAESVGRAKYLLCRCKCGVERNVAYSSLSMQRSLGCRSCRNLKTGKSLTKAAASWDAMMARCYRESHPHFMRYGGAGIIVCERWHDFWNFFEDMGERPDGMTLDRIDNYRGYEKENCRWATPIDQANNRRNNRIVDILGEKMSVSAAARYVGVKVSTMFERVRDGGDLLTGKSTNG